VSRPRADRARPQAHRQAPAGRYRRTRGSQADAAPAGSPGRRPVSCAEPGPTPRGATRFRVGTSISPRAAERPASRGFRASALAFGIASGSRAASALLPAHGRELGVTLEILVGLVEQVSVDLGVRRTSRLLGRNRFTPIRATTASWPLHTRSRSGVVVELATPFRAMRSRAASAGRYRSPSKPITASSAPGRRFSEERSRRQRAIAPPKR